MEKRPFWKLYTDFTSLVINLEMRKETVRFQGLDFRLYRKLSKINSEIGKKRSIKNWVLDQAREDVTKLEKMFLFHKIQGVELLREIWNALTLMIFLENRDDLHQSVGRVFRNNIELKQIRYVYMMPSIWNESKLKQVMQRPIRMVSSAGLRWGISLNDICNEEYLKSSYHDYQIMIKDIRKRIVVGELRRQSRDAAEFVFPTPQIEHIMGLASCSSEEIQADFRIPSLRLRKFRPKPTYILPGEKFTFPPAQMQTIGRIVRDDIPFSPSRYISVKEPRSLTFFCLISLLEQGYQKENPLLRDFQERFDQLEECWKCRKILTHFLPRCPEGCWGCQDRFCTAKYTIRFTEKEIRRPMIEKGICRGCILKKLYHEQLTRHERHCIN